MWVPALLFSFVELAAIRPFSTAQYFSLILFGYGAVTAPIKVGGGEC